MKYEEIPKLNNDYEEVCKRRFNNKEQIKLLEENIKKLQTQNIKFGEHLEKCVVWKDENEVMIETFKVKAWWKNIEENIKVFGEYLIMSIEDYESFKESFYVDYDGNNHVGVKYAKYKSLNIFERDGDETIKDLEINDEEWKINKDLSIGEEELIELTELWTKRRWNVI